MLRRLIDWLTLADYWRAKEEATQRIIRCILSSR